MDAETIGQYFLRCMIKQKYFMTKNKWHNHNEPIDERAYNR